VAEEGKKQQQFSKRGDLVRGDVDCDVCCWKVQFELVEDPVGEVQGKVARAESMGFFKDKGECNALTRSC
jgi:hypothetical protein